MVFLIAKRFLNLYMNVLYHHRTRGKGAEGAHIKGIVTAFREMGHIVKLTSIHNVDPTKPVESKGSKISTEKLKGLKNKTLELTKHMPEFLFEFMEILYNLIALRQIRSEINHQLPDVIYERYSLFMFSTVWYAKRKNIPLILEVNDSAQVERVRHLLFKRLACKIEGWIFKNASGLVFISSYFKSLAEQKYAFIAPSVVSPNAADTKVFDSKKYNHQLEKEKLGLADKTVCGFTGAFHHWHGIDWFVEKVISDLKKHPEIALLLVGDGPRHEFIKVLIEQNNMQQQVVITGRIEHTEIPRAIAAMDFGIIPDSNDYGSPMKLFEFMSMGKGMIVPNFSPIEEVVQNNETSWLFEKHNQEDCIKRFFEIASQPEHCYKVGQNAIKYIHNDRQWRHNVEQIIKLSKHEI